MSGLRSTLIAAAIAVVLALLLLGQCQKARTAGAEAALSDKTNAAATSAAKEAIGAVEAVSGRNSASDEITRENEHAILEAPGAGQLVDPAVSGAGLVGLCRRAAYRGDPKCMRFTPSGGVAATRARSAPAD